MYQILSFSYLTFDFVNEFIPPKYEFVSKRVNELIPPSYEIVNEIKCEVCKWQNLILWYEIENNFIVHEVFFCN